MNPQLFSPLDPEKISTESAGEANTQLHQTTTTKRTSLSVYEADLTKCYRQVTSSGMMFALVPP